MRNVGVNQQKRDKGGEEGGGGSAGEESTQTSGRQASGVGSERCPRRPVSCLTPNGK